MLSQTFGNVSFSLVTICRYAISKLGHALPRTRIVSFNKWRPDSVYLFGFDSKSAYFCFRACATRQKVVSVSSGKKASATLEKNEKAEFVVVFMNDKIWNFERLSVFPERPIDTVTLAYDNVLSNQI